LISFLQYPSAVIPLGYDIKLTSSGSPHAASLPAPESNCEQLDLPSRPISSNPVPPPPKPASSPVVENPISATNGAPHRSSSIEKFGNQTRPVETSDGITSDQAMEAALQETIRADINSHGERDMDIDMEDSYASDPAQLAPQSPTSNQDVAVVQHDPAILADPAPVRDDGDHGQPSLSQLLNAQHNAAIDNEDEYEPPEATPPIDSPVGSLPFSPAPPESVPDLEEFTYDTPALGHPAQEKHSIGESDSGKQVNGSVPHLTEVMHLYWIVLLGLLMYN
jgi:hypothetical protein